MTTTRVIPKSELRQRIRQELEEIGWDNLLITDHGKPLAVAVSVEKWNDLQDSLEDLEDTVAVLESRLPGGSAARDAAEVFAEIEAEVANEELSGNA